MLRHAIIAALGAVAACSLASPYGGPPPVDDAGGDSDVDRRETELELCSLDGTEVLGYDEYMLQLNNRECATTVCLHHHDATFCTHRCTDAVECTDIGQGGCALEINSGDPEFFGTYCVPATLLGP